MRSSFHFIEERNLKGENHMANLSDTLLVSIEFSDKDTGVLVVGRKRKKSICRNCQRIPGRRGTRTL